jgi:Plasmid encoded RepA protein
MDKASNLGQAHRQAEKWKESTLGEVHELILRHGKNQTRELLGTDRLLADIASAVMADETGRMGFTYSGFCLTALPHRNPGIDTWRRDGHRITLLIESGKNRQGTHLGIPYGSTARMILLYLQTRALQTNSRYVEIGRSMNAWLERMGLSIGGNTYRQVKEQGRRISACHLTFFHDRDDGGEIRHNGAFVENALQFSHTGPMQGELWQDTVELNDKFFRAMKEHPVPVLEAAIRQISGKSMALDIYIWLAYRLHRIDNPTSVSWPALYGQFGAGFKALKHFKPEFSKSLKLALAAYPEARVGLSGEGILLHQSHAPVGDRKIHTLR